MNDEGTVRFEGRVNLSKQGFIFLRREVCHLSADEEDEVEFVPELYLSYISGPEIDCDSLLAGKIPGQVDGESADIDAGQIMTK